MMKKLLIFVLVLGMASMANATLVLLDNYSADGTIDVIADAGGVSFTGYIMMTIETAGGWSLTEGIESPSTPINAGGIMGAAPMAPAGEQGFWAAMNDTVLTPPFPQGVYYENYLATAGTAATAKVRLYNVQATSTTEIGNIIIPEPMTVLLLGLGGLLLRRRKGRS